MDYIRYSTRKRARAEAIKALAVFGLVFGLMAVEIVVCLAIF